MKMIRRRMMTIWKMKTTTWMKMMKRKKKTLVSPDPPWHLRKTTSGRMLKREEMQPSLTGPLESKWERVELKLLHDEVSKKAKMPARENSGTKM